MKVISITAAFFLLFSFAIQAQQSDNYYGRYEGDGCNSKIIANIVKVFDNVSGNIELSNDNNKKVVLLAGNEDSEGIIRLKEMGVNTNELQGVLSNDAFSGTIKCNDDESPFEMVASYPEGSIRLNVYYLHSEDMLVDNNIESPSAEIELILVYPEKEKNVMQSVDSVEKFIQQSFFDKTDLMRNPDSLLADYEVDYFKRYKKQNEQWYDNGASFNWQKIVNMSVMHNADYILCNEYLIYAYTGGAHGMTNISYDIVSLLTGKKVEYKDVFREDATDALSDLLTFQLKKNIGVASDVNLKSEGYFVDTIQPNYNIYVNSTGIGFVYNSYEIAPYAMGQTKIHLDFNEVEGLLKEENPLELMIQ